MAELQQYSDPKDPDSDLDYGRNWGDAEDGTPGWLLEGEEITTSDWIITADKEPIPTLIESSQGTGISTDKTITNIFLLGGTPGVNYKLTNTITTLAKNGAIRLEDRTGIIVCCVK